jgi:NAD(P)H-hydrate epimerase
MKIVTSEEMRSLDQRATDELGVSSLILMENAGKDAAREISRQAIEKNLSGEILIFCGPGKNGGDGLVAARHLLTEGHRVRVFLCAPQESFKDESATNLAILQRIKGKITFVDTIATVEEYFNSAPQPHFVVDALLGTGISRAVDGLLFDVIQLLNRVTSDIISLDIPSGIHGSTGAIMGASIAASTTISFGYPKVGHFLAPGAMRRGQLVNIDLGFPKKWSDEGTKTLLTHDNVSALMVRRDRFAHKNTFGHCILLGGSPGRLGAIVMSAQSCLRMGTGLATVASWENSFPMLEIKLPPEMMTYRIQREGGKFVKPMDSFLTGFSAMVLGPGLGTRDEGGELVRLILEGFGGPLVVDADGLNLIAEHKLHHLVAKRGAPTVLTPHPGEMARLLGVDTESVVADPMGAVKSAVEQTGAVVILKGATTLIHSDENITYFNHHPNDGMAKAGSGDVLAGMIGGLMGQGISDIDSARLAVYTHSIAGKLAARRLGERAMTATDIIDHINTAYGELKAHVVPRVVHASRQLI